MSFVPSVDPGESGGCGPTTLRSASSVRSARNARQRCRASAALLASAAGRRCPPPTAWAAAASRGLARRLPRLRRQAAAHPLLAEALTPPAATCRWSIRLVDAYNAAQHPLRGARSVARTWPPMLVARAWSRLAASRLRPAATVPRSSSRRRGEVIWRDALGVTCRRWNWRQTPRTRLEPHSTAMWFVIERLEPMPLDAVAAVGAAVIAAVRELAPATADRPAIDRTGQGKAGLDPAGDRAMYQPPHFREDRLDIQHALIRAHPLGAPGQRRRRRPEANPLPFLIDAEASPFGHASRPLARANPQWRQLDPEQEALVVFQAVDTYVTPSWYATKREHGEGRADLELRHRAGLGPAAGDRGPGLAGERRSARLTAQQEAPRPSHGRSTMRRSPSSPRRSRASSASRSRSRGSRASGRRARTARRPTATGVIAGLERQGDEASRAMARASARARLTVHCQQRRQDPRDSSDRPSRHAQLALDQLVPHPAVVLVEGPRHRRELGGRVGLLGRRRHAQELGRVGDHVLRRRRLVVADIVDRARAGAGRSRPRARWRCPRRGCARTPGPA